MELKIKRAVYIDATSVSFLQPKDIKRLRRAALPSGYIEEKIAEIESGRIRFKLASEWAPPH